MAIVKVGDTYDTGGGHRVQIDAGHDGSVVAISPEHMSFMYRLEEDGAETLLATTSSVTNQSSGQVDTLSDGRYALYTTFHAGLGWGSRVQIFNRDGSAATDVINPMFEGGEDRNGIGYTLTATADGGFGFVWNDVSRSDESFAGTYPPDQNNNTNFTVSAGYDVRIRYFDASGNPTTPSVVADDDVETINGATISRRASDQYVHDSQTLAGGQTAFVFVDTRWVGKQGGAQVEQQLSLQISTPGNVGEPVKIDLGPFGTQFGEYPNTLDNGAGANIVALPDGSFAVIWTEPTYVPADVWGNYSHSGWATYARYFDAEGNALTDPLTIVTRGTDHGGHSKYVWAEALSDGRIAIAYNTGTAGANGNGTLDAFVGVLGPLGESLQVTQVNPAATNTQFYTVSDLAVRSDDTIELVYNDARTQENGVQLNHTVIERFAVQDGSEVVVNGNGFAQVMRGSFVDDVLFGLGGNDTLLGGLGRDSLHGGEGNDVIGGSEGEDRIFGGAGRDRGEGGGGADLLSGGADRDTLSYLISDGGVRVNLSNGITSGAHAAGDRISGFEDVYGSQHNDSLAGDAGANLLRGYGGNDVIVGFAGFDTIAGGEGADTLRGQAGNDRLAGGNLNDTLDGGGDHDFLTGGAGRDTLIGGAGRDFLMFDDGDASGISNQADVVIGHSRADRDRIHLRAIDANETEAAAGDQNFAWIGTGAFGGVAGQLRYEVLNGDAFLQGDTDGDGAADFYIRVEDVTVLGLADLVL